MITGYRKFGIPSGGAFDPLTYRLSNAMLGNKGDEFSIELCNAALDLAFQGNAFISICGAPVVVKLNSKEQVTNRFFAVRSGDTLQFAAPTIGLTTYISVKGGFKFPNVNSQLAQSGVVLATGDVLECEDADRGRVLQIQDLPKPTGAIRVIPMHDGLHHRQFTVSPTSNRAGIRLVGGSPAMVQERKSEPACVGAIQQTASGELIVIGPDGPTIGGYNKIGVVASCDTWRLGQLRPGESVEFEYISLEVARELRQHFKQDLDKRCAELRVASSL